MCLTLRGAAAALGLMMLAGLARGEDDSQGQWTAKSRKPAKQDAGGLTYRTSKETEPAAKAPSVSRVANKVADEGAVQTSFVEPVKRKAVTTSAGKQRVQVPVRATVSANKAAPQDAAFRGAKSDDQYSAVGKLVRGKSKQQGAVPSYAVLDAHGKVVCFVSNKSLVDFSTHVGRQVKVAGEAQAVKGSDRPRVVVNRMEVRGAKQDVRPVMLLQEAQNGDAAGATSGGETSVKKPAARTMEEAPAFDPQAEDVPPPLGKTKPAPIEEVPNRTLRAKPRTMMPEPEAIQPEGAMREGDVYYAPPQIGGEMFEGEIVDGGEFEGETFEGEVVDGGMQGGYAPRGYRRPYPRGPIEWLFGRFDGAWVRADYLLWSTEGMNTPPLVTTSPTGTPRAAAGVLGEDGTSVLFGGNELFDDSRSGARIRAGVWLDECHVWGIEGEYLALEDLDVNYVASSNGDAIISRPFFDMINARETAELVSFPNVIEGQVAVDASTMFQSAGLRLRLNACHDDFCCDPCQAGAGNCFTNELRTSGLPGCDFDPNRAGYRLDIVGGYRTLRLDDSLRIRESLNSLDTSAPGTFDITDSFDTENRFHGGEFGMLFEAHRRRWSLELLTKVALGTTQETVTINGTTTTDEGGDVITENGGLLAQRTNIGRHQTNQFTAVPELGVTIGYQLTEHMKVNVGYTMIYWSRVARAGDQIDLDVNPNLIPPEVTPLVGPERPQFNLVESDFWAHGLNAGLECRW